MDYAAREDLAMILPLPVSSHAEDALRFIALDGYPDFFEEVERGFPVTRSLDLGVAAGCPRLLAVHQVGAFEASFVPTLADLDRLDERFKLPRQVWDQVPQYTDYGFAVFKLRSTDRDGEARPSHAHPMAFEFPTRLAPQLFFPTLHVHDGTVHPFAEFHHCLYFQGETIGQNSRADRTETSAQHFMEVSKALGIVDGDAACFRLTRFGRAKNADILLPAR
jgi:hypothetical protein